MNFKDFNILKENPDIVKLKDGSELIWREPQAIPFGFLNVHNEHFYPLLEVLKDNQSFIDSEKYILGKYGQTHFQSVRLFLKQFEDNIDKEPLIKLLNAFVFDHKNLRKCLQPCGRIWIATKVISFWCTKDKVTPTHLERVFNSVYVPKERRDIYKLEFINNKHPSLTYKQFCLQYNNKTLPKDNTSEYSDLMARAHTAAAHTDDKKLQKFVQDKRREMLINKNKTPLNILQQSYTSESVSV